MKPRRVELDFLVAPRRRRWPGLALLGASLAIAGYLGLDYREARRELAGLEAERALLPATARPLRSLAPERAAEQVRIAQAVVRQLALPWGALIVVLEEASTADVALLTLQPDAEQRVLRLTGEARDREAMFEYLRRLATARALAEVHLVNHQLQREAAGHPIQFSVQAILR